MKKKIASVEARMGSSRLPGKVLIDIEGKPAIERLFERLLKAKSLDGVILATSTSPLDDPLENWANKFGVPCFRGSEDDVLNRVVMAHKKMESDLIIEITGDCTLVDPKVIDTGVSAFLDGGYDIVSNTWKGSYPMGVDVQVFPFKSLEEVERTIKDESVREHVSLYFYEHPEKYKLLNLIAPENIRRPELRFQLDYQEDLDFIRTVYSKLEPEFGPFFGTEEVVDLLNREPEIVKINQHCTEKPVRVDDLCLS
jgi:spore coat polysaccharide biosynthesis protein SpsF